MTGIGRKRDGWSLELDATIARVNGKCLEMLERDLERTELSFTIAVLCCYRTLVLMY